MRYINHNIILLQFKYKTKGVKETYCFQLENYTLSVIKQEIGNLFTFNFVYKYML